MLTEKGEIAHIKGTLIRGQWTDVRVPWHQDQPPTSLIVKFVGASCIWLTEPMFGLSDSKDKDSRNNIIVLILDALRPVDLGIYGGERTKSLTPNIDNYFLRDGGLMRHTRRATGLCLVYPPFLLGYIQESMVFTIHMNS